MAPTGRIHRPDRKRVKYDELSHQQWVADLVVIQSRQPDPTVCDNMGQYLAELFQDVLDLGYNTAKGAHAVVLSVIEERQATWEDINHINLIRTQFSNKIVVHLHSQSIIAPSSNSS